MATQAGTPMHLWISGAVALVWNAFGAFDYLMTRMRNEEYFAAAMPDADPQAVLAWVDAFPFYAQFGWGLGVWGGLLGAILLLARSRWAVPVFAASLVGALLGLGYQILVAPPMPGMEGASGEVMPFVIIFVALGLFLYARAMKAKGVLR